MISIVKKPKNKDADKEMDTEEEKSKEPIAQGLSDAERASLLRSCVTLMRVPVDSDALNAVLRLSLRLTQDFERAVEFSELGGVKMLLALTQASSFSGFTSLATLLIRHVMEDPATLRSTANSNSTTTKELHYLLRVLASAACRTSTVFTEVAKEILRVDTSLWKRGEPEEDPRLLVKSIPSKLGTSTMAPPLTDVASSVIRDLLNFLVQAYPEPSAETTEIEAKDTPAAVPQSFTIVSTPGSNRTQAVSRNTLLVQVNYTK